MYEGNNPALYMDRVSRLYPVDIGDTPSSMLREMFLPRSMLNKARSDSFFALQEVTIELQKGQKLGVIGTHRSGKSTLAGLAAGVLAPTGGDVTINAPSVLLNRPTAGFKPTLTLVENLRIRLALMGFHGSLQGELLERTFARCGISLAEAGRPTGNLSPYIVKQVAMTLLLCFPAEMIVVDGLTSAGIGDARWETRGYLKERIEASAALVVSADFGFIQQVTEEAVLLHQGRLYGPFSVEQAIDHFSRLPEEDVIIDPLAYHYDPFRPPVISSGSKAVAVTGTDYDDSDIDELDHDEHEDESALLRKAKSDLKSSWGPLARVVQIHVDGEEYSHSQLSLIRNVADVLSIEIGIVFTRNAELSHFKICLHPESGNEIGCTKLVPDKDQFDGTLEYYLSFDLEVPDVPVNSYGVSITPVEQHCRPALKDRQKVLKYAICGEKESDDGILLQISKVRITQDNVV